MSVVNSGAKKNLPTIQYFRGFAALFVLLHHITGIMFARYNYNFLSGIFSPGWAGVDFFFVLSGFIITYIHLKDIGKREKFNRFILKRVIRIYPIYWVISLLYLNKYFIATPDASKLSVLKSFLLIPQDNVYPVLQVAWTLSFELFFYLLFGLFIWLRPRLSLILFGAWVLGVIINIPIMKNLGAHPDYHFIFSPFHFEFLLGCLSAYIIRKFPVKHNLVYLICGMAGFVGSWVSILNGGFMEFSVPRIICFGISSALIITGAASLDLTNHKIPTSKLLLYLGDSSYSLYLVHMPVYYQLDLKYKEYHLFDSLGYGITSLISLMSALLIGFLFHSFVDKPLQKYLNKMINRISNRDKSSYLKSA